MVGWWIARAGLFLTVLSVVVLSGPGRIDVVDGQTRYEVARSLVEHGDSTIRDPNVWFAVFPGRDGLSLHQVPLPPVGCRSGSDPGGRLLRSAK